MHGRSETFSKELSEIFCCLESLVFGSDQHVNALVIAALGGRAVRVKRLKVDLEGWDVSFRAPFCNLEQLAVVGRESQETGFADFLSKLKSLRCLRISGDALSLLPHVVAPVCYLSCPPDARAFPVIVQKFGSSLERLEFFNDVSLVMNELPDLFLALPKLRHLTMTGWYWTPMLQNAVQNLATLRDPSGTSVCRFAPQLLESCAGMADLEYNVAKDSVGLMMQYGPRFSMLHVSGNVGSPTVEQHLLFCPNAKELFFQGSLVWGECEDFVGVYTQVRALRFGIVQPESILGIVRLFPRALRLISQAGKWSYEEMIALSNRLPFVEELSLCLVDVDVICRILSDRTMFPCLLRFRMILDEGVFLVRKCAQSCRPWLHLKFDA